MKSNLLSRRDLDFVLYEWLRIDELTKRERFAQHSRETFDGVLDLCEQLATRYFAPHNKKSDANEPSFDGETVTVIGEVKEAWDAFARADLMGMSMDQGLGGAQLPTTVAEAGGRSHPRLVPPHLQLGNQQNAREWVELIAHLYARSATS